MQSESSAGEVGLSSNVTTDCKVPFNQLCHLFEKMHKAKNNNIRKQEFNIFVNKWKNLQKTLSPLSQTTIVKDSFYPAFRLLLPQLDKERLSYGVKEVLLAKLYIDVLGLSKTGQDAKKLLDYKNPKQTATLAGDFAEVAYQHVLSKRCISKGNLTVSQVNEFLDDVARFNNDKKKEKVKKTLFEIIQRTSSIEQKWLIRIMLKDTKIRLGHKVMLKEFHPDAEELYNVTTSLRQVCERLHDVDIRLSDAEIELFQPFRPMLALNAKIEEVEKLMDYKGFIIETKYDGERSQVHKDKNQYKYFSRNGKEYSSVFGETSYSGTLTPYIHDCFTDDVKSCILDGEMMGFHPEMRIFMQKGAQFDIKHVTEDSELQPCLVVFDLVYLNGQRLASMSQSERSCLMRKVIKPSEGRLQFTDENSARTNQDVVKSLNDAIDRREEGIIIKQPDAKYEPNKRKGSGWFKIKPEYTAGVVDDLDLVIIGGSFGSGRRGNFLSTFHLGVGVRDPLKGDSPPDVFKSFCRVGSGYTDKELVEILDKLKPQLKVFNKKKIPDWLQVTKEKPEVYIHPKDSLVVQIRASEIVPSTSYAAGCTLRFPRLISVRDDKDYKDALDVSQLEDLKNIADGKLAARHASLNKVAPPAEKRRKIKTEAPSTISSKFLGADLTFVEQSSTSFEGRMFCILTGCQLHDKQSLERRVAEHGGSVVQNPTSDTYCVVARDQRNVRVKNAIRAEKYDVVRVDWLIRCLDNGRMEPWEPQDVLHATSATEERFKLRYDKYGDEFAKDMTLSSLKTIFNEIDEKCLCDTLPENDAENRTVALRKFINSMTARYETYGFSNLPSSLFVGFTFYLLQDDADQTPIKFGEINEISSLIRFYSGTLVQSLDDVTHVIVTRQVDKAQLRNIFNSRRSQKRKFHIVTHEWIYICVDRGCVVDESEYTVPLAATD